MLDNMSISTIANLTNPRYNLQNEEWQKWRLVMGGGRRFIERYLKQFSAREDITDFANRKEMTYCAAYSKSAIKEIINAIYQRMRDITRVGGPETYVSAVAGREGGVNREGLSMNMFMGQKILPELLPMGRVGIYIDMPSITEGQTIAETYGKRPYVYLYPVEDILNWTYTNQELRSILLRDQVYTYDPNTGMPSGETTRYRYIWQDEANQIYVRTWTVIGKDNDGADVQNFHLKNLKRIPFHLVDIGDSLLTDIADHQIALTNIESSDIAYILSSNFPIWTEQMNNKISPTHTKKEGENPKEVTTGPLVGRTFPIGAVRPEFVSPSPDPLRVSIEKQKEIKDEIRHLVHLAVSKLVATRESADSKAVDNEGLEAGLAFIGLTLEHAENFIAERWCEYLGEDKAIPTVKYPSQYSLQSDSERRAAAKSLLDMKEDIPSTLARKQLISLAVRTLFDGRVSPNIMDDILDEISAATFVSGKPEDIERDVKNGLVTKDIASQARGYPPGTAEQANEEYIARLKLIQETQTIGVVGGAGQGGNGNPNPDPANPTDLNPNDKLKNPAARGVGDLSPNPDANAATEKQPPT